MPEFLTLLPPQQALEKFMEQVKLAPVSEQIDTEAAVGRVLFGEVRATQAMPSFRRSTVDGFAVQAAGTHGASQSLPVYMSLKGEVPMGSGPEFSIEKTECGLIHTGGMLPQGADAVVMVEHTQAAREGEVEVLRAVADGENVLQIGEDVSEGEVVLAAGKRLRPAEIGGLMALGITRVAVARKPQVGIISSGDEVVSPGESLQPGQVRDINSYTLYALVEQHGGVPKRYGIAADTREAMRGTAAKAYQENDLVVITAGSSASARDLTAEIIDSLGEPGVLVHGVNVRPGKPTILAVCDGKPMIGLPGNPVSALVIAGLFVAPVIERALGMAMKKIPPLVQARLEVNLSSMSGREDWVAVALTQEGSGYSAQPIFGKSNLIFTLTKADGLIRIPADANGLAAGEMVDVHLM